MSESAVEIDACAHLAAVTVRNVLKSSLVIRIACTQDDYLHTVIEHLFNNIEKEIQSLLVDQSRDHGTQRCTGIDFELELLLK